MIDRGRSKQRPYSCGRINLRIECSSDELVLALLSAIQVTDPQMFRSGPDGFTVDLTPLEKKPQLSSDERLVMTLHNVFAGAGDAANYAFDLNDAEASRLAETLEILDLRSKWPADVQRMNRSLRERLRL